MEEESARTSPGVLLFHCPHVSGSVGELLAGSSAGQTSKMGRASGAQRQPRLLRDAPALLWKQAGCPGTIHMSSPGFMGIISWYCWGL